MAKTLNGWRSRCAWDKPSGNAYLDGLMETVTSHDGWLCPHCKEKTDPSDGELSNQEYFELIHNSYSEPMERECGSCSEKYFLKAHMTIKYYTCEDKEFEDG
jgi:hypothetical protein